MGQMHETRADPEPLYYHYTTTLSDVCLCVCVGRSVVDSSAIHSCCQYDTSTLDTRYIRHDILRSDIHSLRRGGRTGSPRSRPSVSADST